MKRFLPVLVAALPAVFGSAAVHAQAATAPAASAPASAPAPGVRAEVATAVNGAAELQRAGKPADALAAIDKALAALPSPTPVETAVLQRARGQLASQLDQAAVAVKAFEAAHATNALAAADRLVVEESLALTNFGAKNYAASLDWARKAVANGSQRPGLRPLIVRAAYLAGDWRSTVRELEAQIQAGAKLGDEDLRILASAYDKLKDEAGYTRTLERLLREYPRPEYWGDLLARVPRQPGWQPRLEIDLYRLRMQLDAMDEAEDYLVLADNAARVGLPAEALSVVEAGFAKGLLGKGPQAAEHRKLRTQLTKTAADDRATLQAAAQRAPAAADARQANATLTTGAALVSIGQHERGLEFMRAALGGPLADPAQARLEYALALHRAGRTPEAVDTLRTLGRSNDALGMLARLWAVALAPKKS